MPDSPTSTAELAAKQRDSAMNFMRLVAEDGTGGTISSGLAADVLAAFDSLRARAEAAEAGVKELLGFIDGTVNVLLIWLNLGLTGYCLDTLLEGGWNAMTDTEREALITEVERLFPQTWVEGDDGKNYREDRLIAATPKLTAECRRLAEENSALRAALERLRQWDMLSAPHCADGPWAKNR